MKLITSVLNDVRLVIVVFSDMKRTSDRVHYLRLPNKTDPHGIADLTLPWFLSTQSARNQVFRVDSFLSNPRLVASGVIQGIVLGLFLFPLYISDIFNITFSISGCVKIAYAFRLAALNSTAISESHDSPSLKSWAYS